MEEITDLLKVFVFDAVIPYIFSLVVLFGVLLLHEFLGDILTVIAVCVLENLTLLVWLGYTYYDLSIRAELKQYTNIPLYIYIIITSATVFFILIVILLTVTKRKYKKK